MPPLDGDGGRKRSFWPVVEIITIQLRIESIHKSGILWCNRCFSVAFRLFIVHATIDTEIPIVETLPMREKSTFNVSRHPTKLQIRGRIRFTRFH